MPLDEEQKQTIRTLHFDQGLTAKQIAEQLEIRDKKGKISHSGPLGVIRQELVRKGLAPAPGSAPRKVRETKTVTYDEKPIEDEFARVPSVVPGEQGLGPLFSGIPGVIERVEITRVFALPRSAGTGIVGEVDGQITGADLQAMFGGGRYVCRAYDTHGRLIRSKAIPIAGPSLPVGEEHGPMNGGMPPFMAGGFEGSQGWQYAQWQAAQQHRSVEEQIALERERSRIDREERERRERIEREDRERWNALQVQMMRESHAQQMQIVTTSLQSRGNGLTEMMTVMAGAKELFGDSGGGESDAVTEAIKNGPKMLEGLGALMRSRGGTPVQGQAQAANGEITLDAAGMRFYQELVEKGLSHDEAMAELTKVGDYLSKRIDAKKLTKQPPPKKPAAPVTTGASQPTRPASNGNGQVPVQAIPAQGVPATIVTPEVKA